LKRTPLVIDLPYPNFECIEQSVYNAMVITPAYAGLHGELSAILQYTYHFFYFEEYNYKDISEVLFRISLAEMEHLEILGKLLLKLGVDPVFSMCPPYQYNFYNTSKINYNKTPQKMLLDDISGELSAINEYENMMKRLKSEEVSAVISRIILDEQLHVKALKECLESISKTK
jgi:bacterioferritin